MGDDVACANTSETRPASAFRVHINELDTHERRNKVLRKWGGQREGRDGTNDTTLVFGFERSKNLVRGFSTNIYK